MTDLATLGLAIDSGPVRSATSALDQFSRSANSAERAASATVAAMAKGKPGAENFAAAFEKADASSAKYSKSANAVIDSLSNQFVRLNMTTKQWDAFQNVQKAGVSIDSEAGKHIVSMTEALHDMSGAHSGMSSQAMAAQHSLRSLAEQMAMGVPLTQALSTQMNHLAYAATGQGGVSGAFKEALAGLRGMISPATLLIGGIAALGAAAYAAYSSWHTFAIQLDDTAKAAGLSTQAMAKLQAAASFKGIASDDFSAVAGRFAQSVYQAKNNMGGLGEVLRANGQRATDFETTLGRVADLIMRAKGNTQLQFSILQQSGIPATMQWVRYLEQGSAGLEAAKKAATEFGGAANDNLIAKAREFDESWNKATTNLGLNLRAAVVSASGLMEQFGSLVTKGLMKAFSGVPEYVLKNSFQNGGGSRLSQSSAESFYDAVRGKQTAQKQPTDPNVARNNIALEQQRLGLLGQTATVEEQLRGVELSIRQANMAGAGITLANQDRIIIGYQSQLNGARLLERAELGLNSANDNAAQAQRELAALYAKGTIKIEEQAQALLVINRRLQDTADRAAIAGSAFPQLKALEVEAGRTDKLLDQFATSSLNNMTSALTDITMGTVSASQGFKNLGLSVIRSLEEMIIKMTIVMPIARALQSVLGGGFKFLSGGGVAAPGFSLTATGGLYADGGVFAAQPFASGGAFTNQIVSSPTLFKFANGGSLGVMGEAGPEAIMPLQRGPNGKLGVAAQGGGQGNVHINVYNAPSGTNADVSTKRTASGTQIDITLRRQVEDMVAGSIGRGDGPINQAMEGRYGLDRTKGMAS